jgi:hypothetical protein
MLEEDRAWQVTGMMLVAGSGGREMAVVSMLLLKAGIKHEHGVWYGVHHGVRSLPVRHCIVRLVEQIFSTC